MIRMNFDYNKMLECLSFMELNISELDGNRLKKQYRSLAKIYHPDLVMDYYEKQKRTIQFQKLTNCYEYLNYCLECKYLWQDKISSCNEKDYGKRDNNSNKYYQDIINRLDRMIRPLNIYSKGYCNEVIKYIISILLDNIEILKTKARYSDTIIDYGTLTNYCDLIELFIDNILNIKLFPEFDIDKNNYVGSDNDKFFKEKEEVCLLEKILLYEVVIKIINFISTEGKYMNIKQYRNKMKKFFLIIDEITDSIHSVKWMMVLSNLEIKKIDEELNKIRKKKNSFSRWN